MSTPVFVSGCARDARDMRDVTYALRMQGKTLPAKVSLLKKLPIVFDQGSIGSCTANAGSTAIYAVAPPLEWRDWPSRLFLYYYIRRLQGTTAEDSGGTIRNIFKAAAKYGVASESLWAYDVRRFTETPPKEAQEEAKNHPVLAYESVPQTVDDIRDCIASGYPVCFGMVILENFMAMPKNGRMPMPQGRELGGHALCIVGYDMRTESFLVRNSWGSKWGSRGNFWLPFSIAESQDFCHSFWTAKKIG